VKCSRGLFDCLWRFSRSNNEVKYLLFLLMGAFSYGQNDALQDLKKWKSQGRREVIDFFAREVYGVVPAAKVSAKWNLDRESVLANGAIIRREYLLSLADQLEARVLVYLPKSEKSVPAFLGLNFGGNQSLEDDEWITSIKDGKRGSAAERWPVQMITSQGFAVVTVYCGDFDPDHDDQFQNGGHALFGEKRDEESWGTISGWAWGLSRVLDQLSKVPEIDEDRVAVIGHSRLGKTALWAGAFDERFAMVISNNSGCGGAALSRRRQGETVEKINTRFPHWFSQSYKKYNNKEEDLLFDQDQLVACVAPRLIYVASASEDSWADPVGEFLSLQSAASVYGLFGMKGLADREFPSPGEVLSGDGQWYHLRAGRHDITPWDWERYLKAASLLKKK